MGAKTSHTPASHATPAATGTLTVPTPAGRPAGPLSWTSSAAPAQEPPPRITSTEPRLRQLMGVCGWAAVLGGLGLVIGIRGLVGIVAGNPPGWFEPTLAAVGMLGIALTIGSFLTVHRNRIPWIMLGSSSLVLVASMVITSWAF